MKTIEQIKESNRKAIEEFEAIEAGFEKIRRELAAFQAVLEIQNCKGKVQVK